MQPNNDLAHPPAPFVPIWGTAETFGGGQVGSMRIPVYSSTESGHAVQWRREATLVREL